MIVSLTKKRIAKTKHKNLPKNAIMKNMNFKLRLLPFFIIVLAVSFSCNQKAKKETGGTNSFYTIPFNQIVKNKREVKLSEFADDIEIIQLENTKEAFLGTFGNIEFTKEYFFVQCWGQPILQFSRTGKLIRRIGARGKGPGEYNNCLILSIDEKKEKIYIHTTELSMMVFNFEGDYLKTIKYPALENMLNFWICGRDSTLVSYFESYRGNEPFVFIEHNEQGDTLQGISNYIPFDANEQAEFPRFLPYYPEQNFSYHFANNLHLKSSYNDTVYTYNVNNKFVPKFVIGLGKYKLPADLIYERKWNRPLPDNLCWTGVHETPDYVFIPYGYHFNQNKSESKKEEKGYVLYNKKTKEGVAVEETKAGGFVDDITGGPDFRPIITNANTALMLVSAMDMKQYLDSDEFKNKEVKFPERKEKLSQLKRTLKEEDNYFVVLVKLKE